MIRARKRARSLRRLLRKPGALGWTESTRRHQQTPLHRLQLVPEPLALGRIGLGLDAREERGAVRKLLDHVLEAGDSIRPFRHVP
jgi:hypothetical protein